MGQYIIPILLFYPLAFSVACLSYFLDFCFEEGNIFGFWMRFLDKRIGAESFWYKPLGGCVVCANAWHSIFTLVFILVGYSWPLSWLAIVPYSVAFIVTSNLFLRKML